MRGRRVRGALPAGGGAAGPHRFLHSAGEERAKSGPVRDQPPAPRLQVWPPTHQRQAKSLPPTPSTSSPPILITLPPSEIHYRLITQTLVAQHTRAWRGGWVPSSANSRGSLQFICTFALSSSPDVADFPVSRPAVAPRQHTAALGLTGSWGDYVWDDEVGLSPLTLLGHPTFVRCWPNGEQPSITRADWASIYHVKEEIPPLQLGEGEPGTTLCWFYLVPIQFWLRVKMQVVTKQLYTSLI